MNLTEFLITSFSISKNWLKVQKRPDCWRSIRGAIAPADDITLRCNHSTSHVKRSVGAPQGIEIAPANEFHDFRGLSPPPASLFRKISWFSKCGLMTTHACHRITFLFRNVHVILSENDIQTPADRTILTEFWITSFSASKNQLKIQKRPDCWRSSRGAIAPADDIILRV